MRASSQSVLFGELFRFQIMSRKTEVGCVIPSVVEVPIQTIQPGNFSGYIVCFGAALAEERQWGNLKVEARLEQCIVVILPEATGRFLEIIPENSHSS